MKIDQYCHRQRCKDVELEQFLACFRVAGVCQRQLGFLVTSSQRQSWKLRWNNYGCLQHTKYKQKYLFAIYIVNFGLASIAKEYSALLTALQCLFARCFCRPLDLLSCYRVWLRVSLSSLFFCPSSTSSLSVFVPEVPQAAVPPPFRPGIGKPALCRIRPLVKSPYIIVD